MDVLESKQNLHKFIQAGYLPEYEQAFTTYTNDMPNPIMGALSSLIWYASNLLCMGIAAYLLLLGVTFLGLW